MNELKKEVLNVLISMLASIKSKGDKITPDIIDNHILEITSSMKRYVDVDKLWLKSQLENKFTSFIDDPVKGVTDNHKPWLSAKKGLIEWSFWERYRRYLLEKIDHSTVDEIVDSVSEKVLDSMEDPETPGPWSRRGLVMGNVQSGKTQAYIGVITKAADAGYKVIVVLAGLHNNLRSQTQVRLDEGFLGFKASLDAANGPREKTGVYYFDDSPVAASVTTRDEHGDFNSTVARHFGSPPGGPPQLFVVKKNVTPLKNLVEYIQSFANSEDKESGRKKLKDIPLLVIDDEADQASIDTKKIKIDYDGATDPEHEPTKINKFIRELLTAFDKSAYVAFTATPYANILINHKNETEALGDDLYPKSFIYNLPAPNHYYGPEKIFGLKEDLNLGIQELKPLPVVNIVKDYIDSQEDPKIGWMPEKISKDHIPMFLGKDEIPPSLLEAIFAFILSITARKIRNPEPHHNSMLIHVTRLTMVQSRVANQVKKTMRSIVERINYGEGNLKPTILDQLKDVWDREFVAKQEIINDLTKNDLELPAWDDILASVKVVVNSIAIREVNGRALEFLEYEQNAEIGLNVIAIGGEKLSRGLTLEGLSISYFLRVSDMYDTLMQMGRWFGYKKDYIDVSRLYTTVELKESYEQIASATLEMKNTFDEMSSIGESPATFGLKIRSHPGLLVTSKLKMQAGTKMQISYSGDLNQTIMFYKDKNVNQSNLNAALELIEGGEDGKDSYKNTDGLSLLWEKFKSNDIIKFLSSYKTHEDAQRVNNSLLIQYIEKQVSKNELVNWSVLLASIKPNKDNNNDMSNFFWNLPIAGGERSDQTKNDRNKYTIKVLVDPKHESLDLSEEKFNLALEKSLAVWEKLSEGNRSVKPPTSPYGRFVRECRGKENGLLILYPLSYDDSKIPVMGFAISFPSSNTAETVEYVVSTIYKKTI
jgi:hypothetical protein